MLPGEMPALVLRLPMAIDPDPELWECVLSPE
jgi:hypothetical protein